MGQGCSSCFSGLSATVTPAPVREGPGDYPAPAMAAPAPAPAPEVACQEPEQEAEELQEQELPESKEAISAKARPPALEPSAAHHGPPGAKLAAALAEAADTIETIPSTNPSPGAAKAMHLENMSSEEGDAELQTPSGTVTTSAELGHELPSLGSAGHATGDCKRCCFYPKGRCQNGYECRFCHFDHDKRKRVKKSGEGHGPEMPANLMPPTPNAQCLANGIAQEANLGFEAPEVMRQEGMPMWQPPMPMQQLPYAPGAWAPPYLANHAPPMCGPYPGPFGCGPPPCSPPYDAGLVLPRYTNSAGCLPEPMGMSMGPMGPSPMGAMGPMGPMGPMGMVPPGPPPMAPGPGPVLPLGPMGTTPVGVNSAPQPAKPSKPDSPRSAILKLTGAWGALANAAHEPGAEPEAPAHLRERHDMRMCVPPAR
ncbi:unnamed protein product [Effrenium voratum]|uniref:C3H1-type domain-containing protein n=1 Tax=Effrenium voratum TaxID=2562239 RepID=A0AA36J1X6_9DINO|nr:unnamed protein product [Effrenium voratum]